MKNTLKLFIIGFIILGPHFLWAKSTSLPWSGYLVDSTGAPLDGTKTVTIRVYTALTGGTAVWTDAQSITFDAGVGSTTLETDDSSTLISDIVSSNSELFMTVQVSGESESAPRVELSATPWALVANSLAAGAVTSTTLASSAVTSAKIASGAVEATNLASSAVTSAKISDGTIATADLADSAITAAKITDGTIAAADLADSAITTAKILDGTIANADVSTTAVIAYSKLSLASSILGSDILDGTIATADILDGTIATADLADSSVTTAKIVDSTIAAADLALSMSPTWTGTHTWTSSATTTDALTVTANSLTSGKALTVTTTNSPTVAAQIPAVNFSLTNAARVALNAGTGSYDGFKIGFTHNPSVAGDAETAAMIRLEATSNTTDNAVASLLVLDNSDTSASGSTVVTDAIKIVNTGSIVGGIATAINIADDDVTTDFSLQNGETINNDTNGLVKVTASGNDGSATGLIVIPPTTETIASGGTITADACGTTKKIDAGGNVTTDTSNTFTALPAGSAGCCMVVINVDTTDTITLDDNANFQSAGDANLALGPNDTAMVCSTGGTGSWYLVATSAN